MFLLTKEKGHFPIYLSGSGTVNVHCWEWWWEEQGWISPFCQFSETEPQDRLAQTASQLMSTVDLRESLEIMWHCWVPRPLLHKNRWYQGHPFLLLPSVPLLSIPYGSLLMHPLSSQSPAPPPWFPLHTRERLFGQLVVISSWFGSFCSFDQAVAPRQKLVKLRAQLWLVHDWNWVRRTRRRRRGEEEAHGRKLCSKGKKRRS